MLDVTVAVDGDHAMLALDGEMVQGTVNVVSDSVADALAGGATCVLFDFAGVTVMDSSGLRSIALALERADVEIENVSTAVRRKLEITGFDHLLR